MEQQLKCIGELNAYGLAVMKHGDYLRAGAFFGKALEYLEVSFPYDFCSDEEVEHDVLPFDVTLPLAGPQTSGHRCHEETVIGIFDRGISFTKEFTVGAPSECVKLYTSIAIHYNLALCFHLQALAAPQNQNAHLESARMIYQMACGILDMSLDQREALILQLALMNNLASLNAQLFDVRETQRWLNDLRFTYWSDGGDLDPEDRAIFRANLMANVWYSSRPSAAA